MHNDDLSCMAARIDADMTRRLTEAIGNVLNRAILMRGFDWNPQYAICFYCNHWWPIVLMKHIRVPDYETVLIQRNVAIESVTPVWRLPREDWVCPVCERRPPVEGKSWECPNCRKRQPYIENRAQQCVSCRHWLMGPYKPGEIMRRPPDATKRSV